MNLNDSTDLVMELCDGSDLSTPLKLMRLEETRGLNEELVRKILKDVMVALFVLHNKNIIHRGNQYV